MAAPVIPILSYSSEESVADLLVAPEVGAVFVISPTGVLDLVDYSSSSDSNPSEDSLPVAPELPLVSPFLCINDSKVDRKSDPAKQRPEKHESLTPSSKFPLAPIVSPPRIHHHSSPDISSDSTSSSSSLDSSSDISSGSSSDSLSDSSSVHSSGCDASSPAVADLSPCKRFKYSYSSEVSEEEHIEIGIADAETVLDLAISEGVGAPTEDGIGMGVEVSTSDIREDEEELEAEANAGGTTEIVVDPLATGGIYESMMRYFSSGRHLEELHFRNLFSSTTKGDENLIRTLGDYSKPSHEGYRNTIELPIGNNVVPLRSDTIREGTRLRLFQLSLYDQASNWLERLLAGPITTWEDLTTRFLAYFFLLGRTVKLRNDILMFQQHHGESLSEA
nr:hypothetical protein [Tanacetum cinerariifolium]